MRRLGTTDLEILHLAISKNGTFDENDLENSGLKRLGVGRILDVLASLKDRKMISLNGDGSFSITELARGILWSAKIPTWARILRILQIRSCSMAQMTDILRIPEADLAENVEKLRSSQFVLMSPQRQNDRLVRVYEILSEGIVRIDKTETEGFADIDSGRTGQKAEVLDIVDEIAREVQDSQMEQARKDIVSEKIVRLRDRLEI